MNTDASATTLGREGRASIQAAAAVFSTRRSIAYAL
jgi:hypothetical protein